MTLASTTSSMAMRAARSIGVLAVVAAAGPATGGLLVFCCAYVALLLFGFDPATVRGEDPAQAESVSALSAIAGMASLFVAMGYAFGGPQAVLTGIWAAISTWKHATFSRRGAVLAAIAATMAWVAVLYSPLNPLADGTAGDVSKTASGAKVSLALTPIAIASALFARWLCAKLRLIADSGPA